MRNIVETRIRVEKSQHKTEYFPEYLREYTSWFRTKTEWCSNSTSTLFCPWYDAKRQSLHEGNPPCTKEYAERVIDLYYAYEEQRRKEREHYKTKETSYYKYP